MWLPTRQRGQQPAELPSHPSSRTAEPPPQGVQPAQRPQSPAVTVSERAQRRAVRPSQPVQRPAVLAPHCAQRPPARCNLERTARSAALAQSTVGRPQKSAQSIFNLQSQCGGMIGCRQPMTAQKYRRKPHRAKTAHTPATTQRIETAQCQIHAVYMYTCYGDIHILTTASQLLSTAVSGKKLSKDVEQCPCKKVPESAGPMLKTGNPIWRYGRVLLPRSGANRISDTTRTHEHGPSGGSMSVEWRK